MAQRAGALHAGDPVLIPLIDPLSTKPGVAPESCHVWLNNKILK